MSLQLRYGQYRHIPHDHGDKALVAKDLCIQYDGSESCALHDACFEIPARSRVALIGHNGSGKSTLLKAAARLVPIMSGELLVHGHQVGACYHQVAYLAQRSSLDWTFPASVRELVMTGRYVHLGWFKRPKSKDHEIVERVLGDLDLLDLAERQISHLSGGQQQRCLIARALAQEANLLLLDEPLTGLDKSNRDYFLSLFNKLRDENCCLVVATHALDLVPDHFDQVLELEHGHLKERKPEEYAR